jgi:hypothetical protein
MCRTGYIADARGQVLESTAWVSRSDEVGAAFAGGALAGLSACRESGRPERCRRRLRNVGVGRACARARGGAGQRLVNGLGNGALPALLA